MSTAERIRLTRAAFYQRAGTPHAASAYLIYVLAIAVIAIVIPATKAIESAVTSPAIAGALASEHASGITALIGAGILALAAALGPMRGPVQLPPFLVMSLAGSDLPRRRTFARPMLIAAGVSSALATAIAVIVGLCLAQADAASTRSVVAFALAGAGFGLLSAICWLAGQRLGRRAWILAAALAGAAVVTALMSVPVLPWQWLASTWPTTSQPWAAPALCLGAIAASVAVPSLLSGIRGPDLLTQASRWNQAQACVWSGSLATAVATFRPTPSVGRTWPAASGRSTFTRYLIRDTLTLCRLPVRTIAGTLALAASGALLAVAMPPGAPGQGAVLAAGQLTPGLSVLAAALAGLVGYTAAGTLADTFAHVSENVAGPAFYREGIGQLFALHAIVPLVWVSAALWAGAIVGNTASTGNLGIPAGHLAAIEAFAVLLVALRVFQSVKGMLPLALLTPMPTPMGPDISPGVVLIWQLDAPLIAALGAVIVGQAASWSLAACVGVIVVVAGLTIRRVAKLRG